MCVGLSRFEWGQAKRAIFRPGVALLRRREQRGGKEIDHEKGVIWEHQIKVQGRRAITSGT